MIKTSQYDSSNLFNHQIDHKQSNQNYLLPSSDSKGNNKEEIYSKNKQNHKGGENLIENLWCLLKLLFTNMYKGLDGKKLSMEKSYLTKLNNLLKSNDPNLRRLSLLIVSARLKFQKKFRRKWIHLFLNQFYGNRIVLGNIQEARNFDPFVVKSENLPYTQATLIYSMSTFYKVKDFDEYSLGKLIGLRDLSKVPDPAFRYIWFDRFINKKIKYSLKGFSENSDAMNKKTDYLQKKDLDQWMKRTNSRNMVERRNSERISSLNLNDCTGSSTYDHTVSSSAKFRFQHLQIINQQEKPLFGALKNKKSRFGVSNHLKNIKSPASRETRTQSFKIRKKRYNSIGDRSPILKQHLKSPLSTNKTSRSPPLRINKVTRIRNGSPSYSHNFKNESSSLNRKEKFTTKQKLEFEKKQSYLRQRRVRAFKMLAEQ